MAAKSAKAALGGAHTAGIYADMTVDGPEIGTLVVIVDRAKNLPNRKTMGKQDPYCAARLGKEAKKTETDKRGGQTPKWDQEMRFTVHDSPDYYQLKVSVFNDDKKTELIGETWIALDKILVPGGGQNDVWHTLNCKGRYAGEIRIELTYYDTRPREEKTEERRQSATVDGVMSEKGNNVGGPRQPKPVKRRPLPADPTDSSRSSPVPPTPPSNRRIPSPQQRYVESPEDIGLSPQRSVENPFQGIQDGLPLDQYQRKQYTYADGIDDFHMYEPAGNDYYEPVHTNTPNQHLQEEEIYDQGLEHETEYVNDLQASPFVEPLQNRLGLPHSNSSPAIFDARPYQKAPNAQQFSRSTPLKSHSYDESPIHRSPQQDNYPVPLNTNGATAYEDEVPPPPPIHRTSGSRPSLPSESQRQSEQHEQYASIPATAPLKIRNARGSITGSPLAQVQSHSSNRDYLTSTSPSTSHPYSQSAHSVSSRTSYSQLNNQRPISPVRDYDQTIPPSLVPGYEPSIAEDESERIMHEKRMSARQHYQDPPVAQYQQSPTQIQQYKPASLSRNAEDAHDRRYHRTSASTGHPQARSPDPRTPVRKSLSPQPGSAPSGRSRSEVPFSPDSFDAFNPSIGAAASVNDPGARYNTPEQAREASIQHARKKKLGDEPIIGNDGRIIDPSDHLPTDTWAPEPEQKTPKKGPEITIRFKHSPRGAQPMPSTPRNLLSEPRSQLISAPIYASGPNNVTPNSQDRARLQKRVPRSAMGQPASSPAVPTLNTTPDSLPSRQSVTGYPLREHENYGNYGSSPTYGRSSPGSLPPPIPGKVPIGSGQEDWGRDALSQEMSRIDIGASGGQPRVRRSRYGP